MVDTYITSFYFTTTTVTTVGYGDFYPISPVEQAISIVLQFLGLCVFSTI